MPILPQEPDIYPEDLLDDPPAEDPWWVLYTISRREKSLMRRLRQFEIPFYSPMIEKKTRSSSGRVQKSYIPLFSGYVFLCGTNEQRQAALATSCISRTIEVQQPEELVAELRQIRQLIAANVPLTLEGRFAPGTKVRIVRGPFEGVEGVIEKRHGQDILIVAVSLLQQGVSVAIEDYMIERL